MFKSSQNNNGNNNSQNSGVSKKEIVSNIICAQSQAEFNAAVLNTVKADQTNVVENVDKVLKILSDSDDQRIKQYAEQALKDMDSVKLKAGGTAYSQVVRGDSYTKADYVSGKEEKKSLIPPGYQSGEKVYSQRNKSCVTSNSGTHKDHVMKMDLQQELQRRFEQHNAKNDHLVGSENHGATLDTSVTGESYYENVEVGESVQNIPPVPSYVAPQFVRTGNDAVRGEAPHDKSVSGGFDEILNDLQKNLYEFSVQVDLMTDTEQSPDAAKSPKGVIASPSSFDKSKKCPPRTQSCILGEGGDHDSKSPQKTPIAGAESSNVAPAQNNQEKTGTNKPPVAPKPNRSAVNTAIQNDSITGTENSDVAPAQNNQEKTGTNKTTVALKHKMGVRSLTLHKTENNLPTNVEGASVSDIISKFNNQQRA